MKKSPQYIAGLVIGWTIILFVFAVIVLLAIKGVLFLYDLTF